MKSKALDETNKTTPRYHTRKKARKTASYLCLKMRIEMKIQRQCWTVAAPAALKTRIQKLVDGGQLIAALNMSVAGGYTWLNPKTPTTEQYAAILATRGRPAAVDFRRIEGNEEKLREESAVVARLNGLHASPWAQRSHEDDLREEEERRCGEKAAREAWIKQSVVNQLKAEEDERIAAMEKRAEFEFNLAGRSK